MFESVKDLEKEYEYLKLRSVSKTLADVFEKTDLIFETLKERCNHYEKLLEDSENNLCVAECEYGNLEIDYNRLQRLYDQLERQIEKSKAKGESGD
jgi:hypothetical protein